MYVDVNKQHNYLSKLDGECPLVDLKWFSPNRVQARKAKGKKSVRIDESKNCAFASTHQNKKSTACLWYTCDEMRRFKSMNAQLATQMVRGNRQFRHVSNVWRQALEHAYKEVKEEANEIFDEDHVDFHASVLSGGEQYHLRFVYSGDEELPLGMEHLLVEIIGFERHCRRDEVVDRIFHIEDSYRFPTSEMQEEAIRIASETLSITPRLFYRETAMALAAELRKDRLELNKGGLLTEA